MGIHKALVLIRLQVVPMMRVTEPVSVLHGGLLLCNQDLLVVKVTTDAASKQKCLAVGFGNINIQSITGSGTVMTQSADRQMTCIVMTCACPGLT